MPRDAPTLPRQNTVEFLGKLMRGNSFEGGHQGEQDVDDGRVGALTCAAGRRRRWRGAARANLEVLWEGIDRDCVGG